jgi:N-acetylglutamate synthase-like GNAT family acetyltransferase
MNAARHTLRFATPDDLPFAQRLHAETYRAQIEPLHGWDDHAEAERIARTFRPERTRILQRGGSDIGLLSMETTAREIVVENFSIAPDFQNRGLGSSILKAILAAARDSGLPVVCVLNKTSRAQRLYDRLGFTPVEQTDTSVRLRWQP